MVAPEDRVNLGFLVITILLILTSISILIFWLFLSKFLPVWMEDPVLGLFVPDFLIALFSFIAAYGVYMRRRWGLFAAIITFSSQIYVIGFFYSLPFVYGQTFSLVWWLFLPLGIAYIVAPTIYLIRNESYFSLEQKS